MIEQSALSDILLREVSAAADEMVEFAAELIRVPTINPPGANYRECASLIGDKLREFGFEVAYRVPDDRPEHTPEHPRVNVVGKRAGEGPRPCLHLNGHMDVVPPGQGWTVSPFAGTVRGGRLYGRGSSDMKSGIAAAIFAAEALRRTGIRLGGSIEISATVDEESGGYAGVGWLAEQGDISSTRTDYVIIPEPFGRQRICVGHRGVYWFKVTARGRIAHGSMPFLGVNAIEQLTPLLEAFRKELSPTLALRQTEMSVVPDEARKASLNINAILGGQVGESGQTPCVPDHCEIIVDRRFLIEEDFAVVKQEITDLVAKVAARTPDRAYDLEDLLLFHPVLTPPDSPLTATLGRAVSQVTGKDAQLVASPGTYDQKHVAGRAGVAHCVAYGPGILEMAHQPDEYCEVEDLLDTTKVLALTLLDLVGDH